MSASTLRLAILASGTGTNAQAIFESVLRGVLDADIRILISNRAGAGALERADAFGVPNLLVDNHAWPSRALHEKAVIQAIKEAGADTVALAGYMRLLTPAFLQAFPGRVINIHPALLPAFPGVRGIGDASDWGVRIAGCTVHFVDELMDHGPVIIQAALPHGAEETEDELAWRIHALEHRIYPQALQWLAEGRLSLCSAGKHKRDLRLLPPDPVYRASRPRYEPLVVEPALYQDVLFSPPLEDGF